MKEETEQAGLHLRPESLGIFELYAVSMETKYQLENQTLGWKSPKART